MQPQLDYFNKRSVLLKIESEEGEDALPIPGTDGFRLFEGQSSTEFDTIERAQDKPFLGHDDFSIANKRATISGMFELYPPAEPGQAANSDAWARVVLLPAGTTVSKSVALAITRYNPISLAIPTLTGYWYHTGDLIKALGARVDISALKMEIGQRFTGSASIMGEYTDVTETAMPTVTLPTKVPAVSSKRNSTCRIRTLVRGATASTDATPLANLTVWAKMLQVDLGNSPEYNEYTDKGTVKISRRSTFTLRIAKTDITDDFNPWYVRDNGIVLEADYFLYESDTRIGLYSVLGFRGKIESITAVDIKGDKGYELKGRCIPSDAGNDEWYVGFGDNEFKLRGSLPDGTEEVAYTGGLVASGDYTGTLDWAIESGALPDGLSINAATGAITGSPADGEVGSYTVEISATDDTAPTPKVAILEVTFDIAA